MSEPLSGRALDAAVAERVMGFRKLAHTDNLPLIGGWWLEPNTEADWTCEVPYYSIDLNYTALVRAEIERRGLVGMFLIELTTAIDPGVTVGPYDRQWAFFNASPEQQCRAALKAVEGAHEAL